MFPVRRRAMPWMNKVTAAFTGLGIQSYMQPGLLHSLSKEEWNKILGKAVRTVRDTRWQESVFDPNRSHLCLLRRQGKFKRAKYVTLRDTGITRFVCRMRCGSLPLAAAKHRDHGICPMCDRTLETTHHFLFECPAHSHIKRKYITDDLYSLENRVCHYSGGSSNMNDALIENVLSYIHIPEHPSLQIVSMWREMLSWRRKTASLLHI